MDLSATASVSLYIHITITSVVMLSYSTRRHMCMVMRGVQKLQSKTITSAMLGVLRQDSKSREEFLNLIHRS